MNTSSKAPTAASDGARSAALSKPPWFTDDEQQLAKLGIAYFRNQEFGFVRGEANRSCTQVYRDVSGGPSRMGAHRGAGQGRRCFLCRKRLSHDWRQCGARVRSRPPGAHWQPGGFLVCVAPSRCACAGERIRPSVHEVVKTGLKPANVRKARLVGSLVVAANCVPCGPRYEVKTEGRVTG
jgi:hypothetical protein